MEIQRLIDALSTPDAYPEDVDQVEVIQTHISVVFLTEEWAYKIKKPVDLEFVDYSTLAKRRRYCEREVALNRRLAQEVYRGVVAVVKRGDDIRIEPVDSEDESGEIIEWAVKMVRLPDEMTFESKLRAGEIGDEDFEKLARRMAGFYAEADRGEEISDYARFEAVSQNVRDNLRAAEQQRGELLHPNLYEELVTAVESSLDELEEVIERRAEAGVARDTHGDLRLEHVYERPEREERPYVVVDCIEFNDAFRYADPLSDVGFMAMDLQHEGAWGCAEVFRDAYMEACRSLGDEAASIAEVPSREAVEALLDLYISYRAAVRGKVKGMKAMEEEVSPEDREEAGEEAISYWLHALGALRDPDERPALVMVAGLPGSGKSTVARGLASEAGFEHLDSDVVRKEAAGLSPEDEAPTEPKGGLYADCWSDETYHQLRERARSKLVRGGRVAIEATCRSRERREEFWSLADALSVPVICLVCAAGDAEIEGRLRKRNSGPSDAGVEVYRKLRDEWEPVDEVSSDDVAMIDTGGKPEEALRATLGALQDRRLL